VSRQHGSPICLDDLSNPMQVTVLERVRRIPDTTGKPLFAENLLQQLIHREPSILPIEEIEPTFAGLRSVCQELRLKADGGFKYVDNLLINTAGRICLVECKLWHNPEALRTVVGQILDYAGEVASYSYEDLSAAVRMSAKTGSGGDPIANRVLGAEVADEDRAAFIDGVSSSLELGTFLLLVVGDGIRSGVQQIAGLLQNRATLGFSFGLIEMALYGGKDQKSYYLQPRTLAQTVKIERTVFLTGAAGKEAKISKVDAGGKPQTISEQEFFDGLGKVNPALPARLSGFLDKCKAIGCDPQLRRRYILYVENPNGERMNLGVIYKEGRVEIWGMAAWMSNSPNRSARTTCGGSPRLSLALQ